MPLEFGTLELFHRASISDVRTCRHAFPPSAKPADHPGHRDDRVVDCVRRGLGDFERQQALQGRQYAALYWVLLSIGSLFIALLLAGTVLYLILSVKAINLTRRQSNFIDSVTHELKSPIASMKLYLQTLSRHQVSAAEQADFHRFMLEDLERLDKLINQMLDAGRLEAAPEAEEMEDVEISALLENCARAVCVSYRVPAETVQLNLESVWVHGRVVDIDVIFRNLIDNAVKYAGSPPRVEVTARPAAANQVVVQVADNGRGIPHRWRRKIFGRFVRLRDGTRTRKTRHRPRIVYRADARPPDERPGAGARSPTRAGNRV